MPISCFALIFLLVQIPAPNQLTLNAAMQAALENNAAVGTSEQQQIQATARAEEQRAALLPNVNGLISHTDQTVNLGSRGLDFPGFPFPHRVGPFSDTETRFQLSEP